MLFQPFQFKEAPEPTNIIWENRHFTRLDYIKRQGIAFGIIAVLLAITFWAIFRVSKYSNEISNVFPSANCDMIDA